MGNPFARTVCTHHAIWVNHTETRCEEEVRLLCKRLRFGYDPGLDERLRHRIEGMNAGELQRIVRAFSVYFQLVNIAERYHRIRRRQYESSSNNPPQRVSIASALSRLKGEGWRPARCRRCWITSTRGSS